jgi:hypothetical protein
MNEEKNLESANAASVIVSESELADVSGGEGLTGMCLFRPSGETKQEGGYTWLKCNSSCSRFCCCHGCDHCVGKWHRIDSASNLDPKGFANHEKKNPNSNYDAPNY